MPECNLVYEDRLSRTMIAVAKIQIKQRVTGYLEDRIFAPIYNTPEERERIECDISEILKEISIRPEVKLFENYKVVCDDANNTQDVIDGNSLKIDVYVTPLKKQENLCITITVMPQTAFSNPRQTEPHGQIFCEMDPYGEEDWEES